MKRFSIIIILLFISCNAYAQHPVVSENKYPKVEIDNTEVRELLSNYNGQKYKIYVKFPRNYQNSKKKYPVLYILDAETNFGGVSYIVQRLIKDKIIPEILLIGIAYNVDYDTFYELRSRDLTPTLVEGFKWLGVPYPSGGAENFTKFIKNKLFSFVDEILDNETHRTIFGNGFTKGLRFLY